MIIISIHEDGTRTVGYRMAFYTRLFFSASPAQRLTKAMQNEYRQGPAKRDR